MSWSTKDEYERKLVCVLIRYLTYLPNHSKNINGYSELNQGNLFLLLWRISVHKLLLWKLFEVFSIHVSLHFLSLITAFVFCITDLLHRRTNCKEHHLPPIFINAFCRCRLTTKRTVSHFESKFSSFQM